MFCEEPREPPRCIYVGITSVCLRILFTCLNQRPFTRFGIIRTGPVPKRACVPDLSRGSFRDILNLSRLTDLRRHPQKSVSLSLSLFALAALSLSLSLEHTLDLMRVGSP